jgi:hypothetical protein
MNPRCDICRGEGVIRLPRWPREIVGTAEPKHAFDAPRLSPSISVFPCPECADIVQADQVRRVAVGAMFGLTYDCHGNEVEIEGMRDHAKKTVAHMLASELLNADLISFEVRDDPANKYKLRPQRQLIGRLFVVTRKAQDSFQHQMNAFATSLIRKIRDKYRETLLDIARASASRYVQIGRAIARVDDIVCETIADLHKDG